VGARILAVAGAFGDAAAEGSLKARARIEELRSRAGREFDPMVVEALVLVGIEEGWLDRGWARGASDAADAA
jgi:response regulator RpfG family c-di-GMP phosphodiesterase